jgi:WD40 repeat protein
LGQTGVLVEGPLGKLVVPDCEVTGIAISTDGSFIATRSSDNTICIWRVDTGRLIFGPLYGHTAFISDIAFSPDGKRVVTGSCDHTIRVWDTSRLLGSTPFTTGVFTDDCRIENGWVMSLDGELLFWVSGANRDGLWWPGNTAVIAKSPIKLDFTRFRYGMDWGSCKG